MRMFPIVVLAVSLAISNAGARNKPSKAKLRQAKAVLAKIKLVDGTGSGLNADTVRGVSPIVVLDSQGNFVGAVLENFSSAGNGGGVVLVVRRIGDVTVTIPATRTGFVAPDINNVLVSYDSPDCSGTPLVSLEIGFRPRTATASATTIYFASDAPAATHTILSQRRLSSSDCVASAGTVLPDGTCCIGFVFTDSYQEATQVDISTLGLTPPFHMDITVPESSTTTTTLASRAQVPQ